MMGIIQKIFGTVSSNASQEANKLGRGAGDKMGWLYPQINLPFRVGWTEDWDETDKIRDELAKGNMVLVRSEWKERPDRHGMYWCAKIIQVQPPRSLPASNPMRDWFLERVRLNLTQEAIIQQWDEEFGPGNISDFVLDIAQKVARGLATTPQSCGAYYGGIMHGRPYFVTAAHCVYQKGIGDRAQIAPLGGSPMDMEIIYKGKWSDEWSQPGEDIAYLAPVQEADLKWIEKNMVSLGMAAESIGPKLAVSPVWGEIEVLEPENSASTWSIWKEVDRFRSGYSGGPIIDFMGNVVGVAHGAKGWEEIADYAQTMGIGTLEKTREKAEEYTPEFLEQKRIAADLFIGDLWRGIVIESRDHGLEEPIKGGILTHILEDIRQKVTPEGTLEYYGQIWANGEALGREMIRLQEEPIGGAIKAKMIHKIFGARLTGRVELTLADWYIGASRARELADYALGLFDASVSSIPSAIPFELKHRIDVARDAVESTVLSWEDERLGPKTEEGIPYSATGRGAKARYKDWIKNWIKGMTKELERLAMDAQLISVPVPPIEAPLVAKIPISTPMPEPTPIIETIPPIEREIPPEPKIDPEFLRCANEIAGNYPMVIRPLREEFIRQAAAMLPEQTPETALRFLRRQLEYIKYVGEKKYGAAIPIKRIFGVR